MPALSGARKASLMLRDRLPAGVKPHEHSIR
jgi:hypothetical protein